MHEKPLIDDLLSLGGALLDRLAESRHGMKANAQNHAELLSQKLGLVSRNEFDAALAMIAKARQTQEALDERLAVLEKHLNLSTPKKMVKTKKRNLPSVKTKKKRTTKK